MHSNNLYFLFFGHNNALTLGQAAKISSFLSIMRVSFVRTSRKFLHDDTIHLRNFLSFLPAAARLSQGDLIKLGIVNTPVRLNKHEHSKAKSRVLGHLNVA